MYLKRELMVELESWKASDKRKPLVLKGARQVGKTVLLQEFGRTCFSHMVYLNFDKDRKLASYFTDTIDVPTIISALSILFNTEITTDTLIFFDEIQECPRALASLKYFCEDAPEYPVVAAGSLLGIALHPGTSYPVGKVQELELFPMTFLEFMEATGNERYATLARSGDIAMISTFHETFIQMLRYYYYVGGMPEAVAEYVSSRNYQTVRRIQETILSNYRDDMSKHAPVTAVSRIHDLWDSVPVQLGKENKRFIFGHIRDGVRARDYEVALQWVLDCALAYKVCRVTKPALPLAAYSDKGIFKLYLGDVGLLGAASDLDAVTLLEGDAMFVEFKGALTEQYVHQQLVSACGYRSFYWANESSTNEVDFLFQAQGKVVPLEVKAETNLKAKSFRHFYDKYSPSLAIRSSLRPYHSESWMVNIPLYLIPCLPVFISQIHP